MHAVQAEVVAVNLQHGLELENFFRELLLRFLDDQQGGGRRGRGRGRRGRSGLRGGPGGEGVREGVDGRELGFNRLGSQLREKVSCGKCGLSWLRRGTSEIWL